MRGLAGRAGRHPDPQRTPDLAHEPVVRSRPDLGSLAWDPPNAPPRPKADGHRRTKRSPRHSLHPPQTRADALELAEEAALQLTLRH